MFWLVFTTANLQQFCCYECIYSGYMPEEEIPESGPKEDFRKGKVTVNFNFMPSVMNYWHEQQPLNLLAFISLHKH